MSHTCGHCRATRLLRALSAAVAYSVCMRCGIFSPAPAESQFGAGPRWVGAVNKPRKALAASEIGSGRRARRRQQAQEGGGSRDPHLQVGSVEVMPGLHFPPLLHLMLLGQSCGHTRLLCAHPAAQHRQRQHERLARAGEHVQRGDGPAVERVQQGVSLGPCRGGMLDRQAARGGERHAFLPRQPVEQRVVGRRLFGVQSLLEWERPNGADPGAGGRQRGA
eukprot:scaffold14801_cov105-Isochrysis_galbana.AAC.8